MLLPVLIAGFTLGAAGSLHCVGMCGPLSLALPTHQMSGFRKFISLFLYQTGRIITYALLGLIFGIAGRRLYLSGFQQWFSIGLGIVVLTLALLYFLQKHSLHFSFVNRLYQPVQRLIGSLLRTANGPIGFLTLGMANGLLPCGMVYIAVATTLSFTTLPESVLFMSAFGAGTLPAMMGVAYAGRALSSVWRAHLRSAVPVFISLMGIVLILRGMNLGIPFISPLLPGAPEQAVVCHP